MIPDWILEAAAEIAGLRAYNTEHFNYPEFEQQVAEVIAKHAKEKEQ